MGNNIKEWIEKTGHALEMRSARTLRQAGFASVIQSEHYFDTESKQHRETDVVAYRSAMIGTSQMFVALVFECKSTRNKPWVLFTREQQLPAELTITQRAWAKRSSALKVRMSIDEAVQRLSVFGVPSKAGYKLAVGYGDSDGDPTYKASMSVVNACQGMIDHLHKVSSDIHVLALPFIVLGGTLLVADLDPSGHIEIAQVDDAVLAWRNRSLAPHTFIRVLTEEGLARVASTLLADTNGILGHATTMLGSGPD